MVETDATVVRSFVSWEEINRSFDVAVDRFVTQLRDLPDAAGGLPVPGMTWNVAETAAHLIGILGRGLGDRRRAATLEELAELNAACIDEVDERSLSAIADVIEERAEAFRAVRPHVRGDEPFELHVGLVAESAAALSYGTWDLFVHGWDIARATDRPWSIPREHAARVLTAGLPALAPWIRPQVLGGETQQVAVAFDGQDAGLRIEVGDGRYGVERIAVDEAEATLDPEHALLAVSHRVDAGDPLTARLADLFEPI